MTEGAAVSVVIPTWNRVDLLTAVLADVARQICPVRSVIVVDNGSTDGSAAAAGAAGAKVIQLPGNQGFAAAVNRGIEECSTEWVAIINNDVSLPPDWMAVLLEAARREDVWFATGKLNMQRQPTLLDGTYDAVCRGGAAWRCGHGRPDGPVWNIAERTYFPSMTALMVKRDLFAKVGFLDETFESYLEDIDFGIRCAAAGVHGLYVPGAVATHAGSATLGAWHKATVRRIARNQSLLIRKHFQGAPRWPILVAQLLWGITALRHGAGLAWFQGKWAGIMTPVQTVGQWTDIRDAVTASEAGLLRLQRETGFDLYWRLYFALVRTLPSRGREGAI